MAHFVTFKLTVSLYLLAVLFTILTSIDHSFLFLILIIVLPVVSIIYILFPILSLIIECITFTLLSIMNFPITHTWLFKFNLLLFFLLR